MAKKATEIKTTAVKEWEAKVKRAFGPDPKPLRSQMLTTFLEKQEYKALAQFFDYEPGKSKKGT